MTPQEKAIKLHSKFLRCKDFSNSYYVIPIYEDAIQCALIAVDEILNDDLYIATREDLIARKEYWHEVKQEIEQL